MQMCLIHGFSRCEWLFCILKAIDVVSQSVGFLFDCISHLWDWRSRNMLFLSIVCLFLFVCVYLLNSDCVHYSRHLPSSLQCSLFEGEWERRKRNKKEPNQNSFYFGAKEWTRMTVQICDLKDFPVLKLKEKKALTLQKPKLRKKFASSKNEFNSTNRIHVAVEKPHANVYIYLQFHVITNLMRFFSSHVYDRLRLKINSHWRWVIYCRCLPQPYRKSCPIQRWFVQLACVLLRSHTNTHTNKKPIVTAWRLMLPGRHNTNATEWNGNKERNQSVDILTKCQLQNRLKPI